MVVRFGRAAGRSTGAELTILHVRATRPSNDASLPRGRLRFMSTPAARAGKNSRPRAAGQRRRFRHALSSSALPIPAPPSAGPRRGRRRSHRHLHPCAAPRRSSPHRIDDAQRPVGSAGSGTGHPLRHSAPPRNAAHHRPGPPEAAFHGRSGAGCLSRPPGEIRSSPDTRLRRAGTGGGRSLIARDFGRAV